MSGFHRTTVDVNNRYGLHRIRLFCRFGHYIGCLGLLAASGMAQSSHGNRTGEQNSGALIQALASDVRALRLELIDFRIEVQERTLPALHRELKNIAAEHAGLEAEESQARHQLQAFDPQLASSSPDEHLQAQLRPGAGVSSVDIVRAKRAELASRQTQLETQMRTEIQRLNVLREKAKALSAGR